MLKKAEATLHEENLEKFEKNLKDILKNTQKQIAASAPKPKAAHELKDLPEEVKKIDLDPKLSVDEKVFLNATKMLTVAQKHHQQFKITHEKTCSKALCGDN